MTIRKRCFCCGKENELTIPDSLKQNVVAYMNGFGYIQDIPLSASEREFIKTGMCMDCQHMMFDCEEEE